MYKIITKILVNRLRPVMDYLIAPYQSSFILGDELQIITLLPKRSYAYLTKKGKKGFLAIKVDLNKAFDQLE